MGVWWGLRILLREAGSLVLWVGANVIVLAILVGGRYGTPVVGAAVGLVTGLICWSVSLKVKRYTNCPRCGGSAKEGGEPTNKNHYDFCSYCGGAKILRPGAEE